MNDNKSNSKRNIRASKTSKSDNSDDDLSMAEDLLKGLKSEHLKEQIDEKISELNFFIKAGNEHGINVTTIADLLRVAKDKYSKEKYEESDELLNTALKHTEKLKKQYPEESFKLSKIDEEFEEPEIMEDAVEELEPAKRKVVTKKKKMKKQKKIAKKPESAERVGEEAEKKPPKMKKEVKKEDSKIYAANKYLNLAKLSMKNDDYDKATMFIIECKKEINRIMDKSLSQREMEELAATIKELENVVENITRVEEEPEHVEEEVEFEISETEAEELVEEPSEEGLVDKEELKNNALAVINALKQELEDAQAVNIDSKKYVGQLAEAETEYESENYDQAKKVAETAKNHFIKEKEKLLHKRAKDIIVKIEGLIKENEALNLNTKDARDLLIRAETALKEEEYQEVGVLASQSEELLINAKNKYFEDKSSELLKSAEARIDEGRSINANVDEAEDLYQKALEDFEEKEYAESMKKSHKSIDLALMAESVIVMNSLKSSRQLILELGQKKSEIQDIISLFNLAKAKVVDKEYIKALELSKELQSKIGDKGEELQIKVMIESVESKLKEAKDLGADMTKPEAIFKEAKKYFEEKKYEGARSQLEDIDKFIETSKYQFLSDEAGNKIKKLKPLIEESREVGIDVSKYEDAIKTSEKHIEAEDFSAALKAVEGLESQINDERQTFIISKELNECRLKMVELKSDGLDVSNIKKLYLLTKKNLENKDFEAATVNLNKTRESIEESSELHKIENALDEIKRKIEEIKDLEIDINRIEEIYDQALKAKKDKEYQKAMELINTAESELKDTTQKHYIENSKKAIRNTELKIKRIIELEVEIDLKEIEDLLEQSKELFENEEYAESEKKAVESSNLAEKQKNEICLKTAKEYLLESKTKIKEMKDLDVDLDELNRLYNNALKNLKEKNYEDGLVDAKLCRKEVISTFGSTKATETFNKLKDEISNLKDLGVKIENFEIVKLYEYARNDLDNENYDECMKNAQQGLKAARELKQDFLSAKAEERLDAVNKNIKELEEQEIDLTQPKQLINKSQKSFEDKKYEESIELSENAHELLEQLKSKNLAKLAKETISDIKIEMKAAKKAGIDIEQFREDLEEVKRLFKEEKFEDCIKLTNSIKDRTMNLKDAHLRESIENELNEIKSFVVKIKNLEGDTEKLEESIKSIQEDMEKEDLERCLEDATKLKTISITLFQKQSNIVFLELENSCKSTLKEAKKIDADITEVEATLKQIRTLFEKKDYEGAINIARECKSAAENLLLYQQTYNEYKQVESELEEFEELEIGSEEPKEMIASASSALKDAKYDVTIDMINKARTLMIDLRVKHFKQLASDSISEANSSLEEIEKMGMDITEAEAILGHSKTAFDEQEYMKARKIAENTKVLIEEQKQKFYRNKAKDEMTAIKALLTEARSLGVDIDSYKNDFQKLKEAYESKKYKDVLDSTEQYKGLIVEAKETFLKEKAEALINEIKSITESAGKIGFDFEEAKKLLTES
ncbi:MAG: hypothetical protein JSW07_01320, partial [bacterium]